jgi:hypothetical protein
VDLLGEVGVALQQIGLSLGELFAVLRRSLFICLVGPGTRSMKLLPPA